MSLLAAVLAGLTVLLSTTCTFAREPLGRLVALVRERDQLGPLGTLEERVGEVLGGLLARLGTTRLDPRGWFAGLASANRMRRRRLGRAVLAAAAPGLAAVATGLITGSLPAPQAILAFMLAGGLLPDWWEARTRRARARELNSSLPQFLDFMEVCQQAGLNLRGSLERAALAVGGRLGSEVRILLDACPPAQLLSELAEKYDAQDLKALGGALRQGELLGIPLADILRAQAQGLREAGRRRMQAAAATAPLKLSLCTVCFFLPSILALVLIPHLLVFLTRW
ncbi:MAG: type II secretion system F family protein [Firmicutes bacterium]|nr:type II secretion system F family protein [Bacillota bacterium]